MKRLGTFSAAAGLIFLGVWMLIYRENQQMGNQVLKFWPVIIIILGIEVLIFSSHRMEDSRPRFNFLVIPIILVFLFINVFQGIGYGISNWGNGTFNFPNIFNDANYNMIESKKVLEGFGTSFSLQGDNEDIQISKSNDKNISIEARVYVDKGEGIKEYAIKETKESDGYSININEAYVKKVKLYISIPDGLNVSIKGDNISLNSNDKLLTTNMSLSADNGNCNLSNVASVKMNIGNSNISLSDIPDINIKSDNSKADVKGNAEKIYIDAGNGSLNISNNICKDVNIQSENGIIDLNTQDKNINVNAQLTSGACSVNEIKRVNTGITASYGNGQNSVKIKLNSGVIKVKSQE